MADFFGKLKQTIDKSAKVITARSSSAIDSTKIKSEINELKKSKNKMLFSIGKKVYESDRDNFSLEIVYAQINDVAKIDVDIATKEAELERIKTDTEEKLDQINKSFDNPEPSSTPEDTIEEVFEETEIDFQETEIDFEDIDEPKDN